MFPCVKSKAAAIVGMILVMATLSTGQGFNLEWEINNLLSAPSLPSYIVSDQGLYGQMKYLIIWETNLTLKMMGFLKSLFPKSIVQAI